MIEGFNGESVQRRSFLKSAAGGAATLAASGMLVPSLGCTSSDGNGAASSGTTTANPLDQLPPSLRSVLDEWSQSPSSHKRMGDWRRVGYRRGTADPQPSGRTVTASSIGIDPGHDGDVSVALQAALDDLGSNGGGILQIDAGRYTLDNPLFIRDSNVVLQGAGKDQTTLYFTRPLAESVRPGTFWSWTGGQVFFASRERLESKGGEGFLVGPPVASVSPATRGAQVLGVSDTSSIVAGTMMMLQIEDSEAYDLMQEMGGNVAGAATYDWTTAQPLRHATWQWPVVIEEIVSDHEIRIEQPLRVTIAASEVAQILPLEPTVHDSGVEGLTIENKLITQTAHNENPGSNGVCFQAVYDCWATDIHVLNADVAYSMTAAKSCTLTGISAGGRALHHFTVSREGSHDNLIQDFHLEDFTIPLAEGAYTHGISVERLGSGNVWRRGHMDIGTFDSHRAMPFENLRTDITLVNKVGVPGGAFSAGPCYGTRFVHWGIHVTTDTNLCIGITDVSPSSMTAGITGLTADGSQLTRMPAVQSAAFFDGDLESQSLEFGTDLGPNADLVEIQRSLAPV